MEEIRTGICGLCGGECLVDARVIDGRIVSVEGNTSLPGSRGKLCVKGAALKQQLYHPYRLLYPLKRVGERGSRDFVRISWEEALDTIAERLRESRELHGADQTLVYVGHPKWFRPQLADFTRKFGTCNYGTESSTCAYARVMAFQTCYGTPAMFVPDMKHAETLLIWGNNPCYSRSPEAKPIQDFKDRGKTLIVVDPRCTPTTEIADLHLQALPGTDGALALGLAHVLIEEDLYDRAFVEENSVGFERYRDYVRAFTPEKVEQITTVPAEQIVRAARLMAKGPCALKMSASPVVHHINGFQNARAVVLLMALTGNYGRPGGIMAPGPKPVRLRGAFAPGKTELDHMERSLSYEKYPLWSQLIGEVQVCELSRYILGEGKYPIRNLLTFGMNHRMWPEPRRLEEAFRKLEFFVSVDAFMTEASTYADIVLPCALACEREQVKILAGKYAWYQPKMLEHGELKSDMEILLELARRLDIEIGQPPIHSMDEYFDIQLGDTGLTVAELRRAGEPVPIRRESAASGPMKYPTPSGKIEFCSGLLPGEEALPLYKDFREMLPMDEYPLILSTGCRKPQLFHSRTYRLPWLERLEPVAMIDIRPEQAAALDLADGELATIETPVGALDLTIHYDPSCPMGMVCVYHGAGEKDINNLIDLDYADPYSGFPGFKAYCCRIRKKENGEGKEAEHELRAV